MTEASPVPAFYAALARAQASIAPIAKDGDNKHHRYRYTTADRMTEECGRALNAEGMSFFRRKQVIIGTDQGEIIRCTYVLAHEGGHTEVVETEIPVLPTQGQPRNKAVAVALTYALGFTMRDTLAAARSDGEPDDNRNGKPDDNRNGKPKRKGKTPAKPAAPPPPMPPELKDRLAHATAALGTERCAELVGSLKGKNVEAVREALTTLELAAYDAVETEPKHGAAVKCGPCKGAGTTRSGKCGSCDQRGTVRHEVANHVRVARGDMEDIAATLAGLVGVDECEDLLAPYRLISSHTKPPLARRRVEAAFGVLKAAKAEKEATQ